MILAHHMGEDVLLNLLATGGGGLTALLVVGRARLRRLTRFRRGRRQD